MIDMQDKDNKPLHDAMCVFKVADFTTEIVGRYDRENSLFYVQRGDGTRYTYAWGIEWFRVLAEKEWHDCWGGLSDICWRLHKAKVGACSCLTKTPEVGYHNPTCSYRLFHEALVEIDSLRSKLAKIRQVGSKYDTK
jgi:hypothetical protein